VAQWDSGALAHLEDVVGRLGQLGVPDTMAGIVGGAFRRNLERYEPSENGDTLQLLALNCAVNISQLAARHFADPAATRSGRIRAALPDSNSLVVWACDVTLRVRKAPGSTLSPVWPGFKWREADGVGRHVAAAANSAAYQPAGSEQDGRCVGLDTGGLWSLDDPTALKQVMLAWGGDMETGLTAGWLGIPCIEAPSWFAVTSLWRDELGCGIAPADTRPDVGGPSDDFADQPEPRIELGLRPQTDEPGWSSPA
jgi:hypothetical protein